MALIYMSRRIGGKMIPKIIHYCWFGNSSKSPQVLEYINTWKSRCPEYQIIEWNERNFDICSNRYCKEAYERKKWAFVSDYVRLKVLYEHGGIYLDTDVELKKNINSLLNFNAVFGFETEKHIQSSFFACTKNNEIIKELLDDYEKKVFIYDNNKINTIPNIILFTEVINNIFKGLNPCKINIINNVAIFPWQYFSAKSLVDGKIYIIEDTYAVHHFSGSWLDNKGKIKRVIKHCLSNLLNVLKNER